MSGPEYDFSFQRHPGRRSSDAPPSGDLGTLNSTKDKLLMGVMGTLSAIGLALLTLVLSKLYDIDMRLARVETLGSRVERVENWTIHHDQEDRTKFQSIAKQIP